VLVVLGVLLAVAVTIIGIAVATHIGSATRHPATATGQAEENYQDAVTAGEPGEASRETLRGRLAAASVISESEVKDKSLAAVAADAAKAGQVDLVKDALRQMYENSRRNEAARESALLLAKHGLREQAIEVAKIINERDIRDQTLSELAQ
jgi:hypothetical protein